MSPEFAGQVLSRLSPANMNSENTECMSSITDTATENTVLSASLGFSGKIMGCRHEAYSWVYIFCFSFFFSFFFLLRVRIQPRGGFIHRHSPPDMYSENTVTSLGTCWQNNGIASRTLSQD